MLLALWPILARLCCVIGMVHALYCGTLGCVFSKSIASFQPRQDDPKRHCDNVYLTAPLYTRDPSSFPAAETGLRAVPHGPQTPLEPFPEAVCSGAVLADHDSHSPKSLPLSPLRVRTSQNLGCCLVSARQRTPCTLPTRGVHEHELLALRASSASQHFSTHQVLQDKRRLWPARRLTPGKTSAVPTMPMSKSSSGGKLSPTISQGNRRLRERILGCQGASQDHTSSAMSTASTC